MRAAALAAALALAAGEAAGCSCRPAPSAEEVLAEGKAILRGRIVETREETRPLPPLLVWEDRECRGPDGVWYPSLKFRRFVRWNRDNAASPWHGAGQRADCRPVSGAPPTMAVRIYRVEPMEAVALPEVVAVVTADLTRCDVSWPLDPAEPLTLVLPLGQDEIAYGVCSDVAEPVGGWDAFFARHAGP